MGRRSAGVVRTVNVPSEQSEKGGVERRELEGKGRRGRPLAGEGGW